MRHLNDGGLLIQVRMLAASSVAMSRHQCCLPVQCCWGLREGTSTPMAAPCCLRRTSSCVCAPCGDVFGICAPGGRYDSSHGFMVGPTMPPLYTGTRDAIRGEGGPRQLLPRVGRVLDIEQHCLRRWTASRTWCTPRRRPWARASPSTASPACWPTRWAPSGAAVCSVNLLIDMKMPSGCIHPT